MCIMIGLQWFPIQDIKPYNSPNYFFGLSLDKTAPVNQNQKRETISAVRFDISRLILERNKGEETSTSKRSS